MLPESKNSCLMSNRMIVELRMTGMSILVLKRRAEAVPEQFGNGSILFLLAIGVIMPHPMKFAVINPTIIGMFVMLNNVSVIMINPLSENNKIAENNKNSWFTFSQYRLAMLAPKK